MESDYAFGPEQVIPIAGIDGAFVVLKFKYVVDRHGNGTEYKWLKAHVKYRFRHDWFFADYDPSYEGKIRFFKDSTRWPSCEQTFDASDLSSRVRRGGVAWLFMRMKMALNDHYKLGLFAGKTTLGSAESDPNWPTLDEIMADELKGNQAYSTAIGKEDDGPESDD